RYPTHCSAKCHACGIVGKLSASYALPMAQASRVRTSRYAARILPPRPDGIDKQQAEKPPGTGGANVLRRLRALRRAVSVLVWTLVCVPIQALCLMLPGRPKVLFPRLYWWAVSRLLGLRVRVVGTKATAAGGRPVVFVSNHSSWLDIPVLGGALDACFV